ncbi:MAG: hypothetical protein K0B52_05290 [FCB group bacterium]|nr:hypothetical protein [FCB group bacterium]
MKKRMTITLTFLAVIAMLLVIAGCAGAPKTIQAEKPSPVKDGDYFPEGVYLAALQFVSWEDRITTAKVYPVTILAEASENTKHQAEVKPVIPIAGAGEDPDGSWKWTQFVFTSRPAVQDELETGMWILCVNLERPMETEELKNAEWAYRQISSLDELHKDLVEVRWYDTYYWQDRTWKVNVKNIRIPENHFPEDAAF